MTLWTTHKITGTKYEDNFQGWKIELPGKPVEVARTEHKENLTEEDALVLFSKAIDIPKHGRVTKLYEANEDVVAFMLTERGVPIAFIVRVSGRDK